VNPLKKLAAIESRLEDLVSLIGQMPSHTDSYTDARITNLKTNIADASAFISINPTHTNTLSRLAHLERDIVSLIHQCKVLSDDNSDISPGWLRQFGFIQNTTLINGMTDDCWEMGNYQLFHTIEWQPGRNNVIGNIGLQTVPQLNQHLVNVL
jgi:hypothetical protein